MHMKNSKGYTLIEMVISIAVGLVIIAAIYAAVNIGQRSTGNVERRVAAHQDARSALELMSLEIQMASYNSLYTPNIWKDPVACTAVSGNQNYRGIQAATASSISVEADVNENGVVGSGSNEIITYTFDAANQYITRETNCGGNLSFLGALPGNPRAVRVINTAAVPVFRYYDAQGTEITTAGLPAGIPNIARIDITVWVETEDKDPDSGQRRQMIYSTNVIPRNHVIKE
jgi:prepilin-type N-terminal cleavage/methylation domain-containing protein